MLSLINQNKFVPHMINQLKQYPHSPLQTMELHARFTFGAPLVSEIENNSLILWLEGVSCVFEKTPTHWNIWVDGDKIEVVYYS